MKNIYLICGKSGVGKDTIVNDLCKRNHMKKLVSYTTRPKRPNEFNTHIFINKKRYLQLQDVVCSTLFDGNYYCATKKQIEQADIYIIDRKGIEDFKKNYKGDRPYKIIYLTTFPWLRKHRMLQRDKDTIVVENRIKNDKEKFKGILKYVDKIIWNINKEKTIENLQNYIIESEVKEYERIAKETLNK